LEDSLHSIGFSVKGEEKSFDPNIGIEQTGRYFGQPHSETTPIIVLVRNCERWEIREDIPPERVNIEIRAQL
jgi:hypothetical protein